MTPTGLLGEEELAEIVKRDAAIPRGNNFVFYRSQAEVDRAALLAHIKASEVSRVADMREAAAKECERLRDEYVGDGLWPFNKCAKAIRKLPLPSDTASRGETDLLDELAKRPSWELSSGDAHSYEGERAWYVHKVTGNSNDKEWTQLSEAETPRGALQAALTTPDKKDM